MYCPKCGAGLTEGPNGWLLCSSGELEFSLDLSQKLRVAYRRSVVAPDHPPDLSGRTLFCPGCAIAMPKGQHVCPNCSVSIRPFIAALIEFHPHGDGTGKYF